MCGVMLACLSTVILVSILPATAHGESPAAGDVLWLFQSSNTDDDAAILHGVDEALTTHRQRHLVGVDELQRRVDDGPRLPGECATGVQPCGAAQQMAFDALGIGWMVRLVADRGDDTIEVNYEMVDRRGEIADSGRVVADDERQAGFELVGELFDAVGVVSFESEPASANVFVDGESVGTTPVTQRFGIGEYPYRIERDGYEAVSGTVQIASEEPRRVEVDLQQRPGRVQIVGAPEAADVTVDGEHIDNAGEIVELPAGRRVIELRADEYEAERRTVEIAPGETTELQVQMRPRTAFLRDVEASAIADHRLQMEVGVELGGQMTRFPGARTIGERRERIFGGWLDGSSLARPGDDRRLVTPGGVRVGVSWEGEWFGLGLLSMSLVRRSIQESFQLVDPADGAVEEATMQSVSSLQLRPMQLRARFFYENLAPFAQVGFGVNFQAMSAETASGRNVSLRRVDPFGVVETGMRYHFDPRWSVGASYRMQASLAGGTGFQHVLGINVGLGVRELDWLEPQPPEQL